MTGAAPYRPMFAANEKPWSLLGPMKRADFGGFKMEAGCFQ